ncbi:MAG: ribosomal protein S18-alanine N-acetyltransferase [Candidatus Cloacimonadaceae bacterium]|nr:ribosomal protein S18-alanine N-acetyltransferase [Candidatus Cloacimonadaceae bacterium]
MPSIRVMRAEDKDKVYRIECAAFPHPWPEDAFEEDSIFDRFLICEGEDILGYIFCHSVLDECSIVNFAIDPAHQRKGYGTLLLDYTLKEALPDEVRYVYLDVRASNLAAQSIYGKYGFKTLGIRRHYYNQPDEDSLVMQMILPGKDNEEL